ncbi:uncharacterized protein BBA_09951 [Beauveria bassiana ARSEF 2860]|uniref:Uncharacterized protein n=1 Tax=Beauveria bassiana (strain ARSEF 2860) TaxID=655819 RepID=J4KKV5_BEAB2|nr:uncharacterized protein BBA_09951 [Beauveria bassiana ARSEF 2860]EJP61114.1 hypothetical protein BBA_09951 [Beauveria bassiana ARSEF 2860]
MPLHHLNHSIVARERTYHLLSACIDITYIYLITIRLNPLSTSILLESKSYDYMRFKSLNFINSIYTIEGKLRDKGSRRRGRYKAIVAAGKRLVIFYKEVLKVRFKLLWAKLEVFLTCYY